MKILLITTALLLTANCLSANSETSANQTKIVPPQNSLAAVDNTAAKTNSTQAAPDAIVKELYARHDKDGDPFFQTKNRALVDKFFVKKFADLIWKDATTTTKGEVGALDFDPLYAAQDFKITDLQIRPDQVDKKQAVVIAKFKNFGKAQSVLFNVELENGVWKIANITTDDYNLFDLYKAAAEDSKTASSETRGEFEGKYKVGETTCTVKPIKMAFEIKWAKGTGTEIFFASVVNGNGKATFSSDADNGKSNVFVFDDENYNSGVFKRADGKEFSVKRAK